MTVKVFISVLLQSLLPAILLKNELLHKYLLTYFVQDCRSISFRNYRSIYKKVFFTFAFKDTLNQQFCMICKLLPFMFSLKTFYYVSKQKVSVRFLPQQNEYFWISLSSKTVPVISLLCLNKRHSHKHREKGLIWQHGVCHR